MILRVGDVPKTEDFHPDANWHAIREPSPLAMQFWAILPGVLATLIVIFLWLVFAPTHTNLLSASLYLLPAVLVVIPVHELIHAACHPQIGMSHRTVLGFWPAKLAFFAHYHGPLPRNRFLLILIMPFLLISLFPILIAGVSGFSHDFIVSISLFNAFGACGDLLGVILVVAQIPSDAIIQNQQWRTYWRDRDT